MAHFEISSPHSNYNVLVAANNDFYVGGLRIEPPVLLDDFSYESATEEQGVTLFNFNIGKEATTVNYFIEVEEDGDFTDGESYFDRIHEVASRIVDKLAIIEDKEYFIRKHEGVLK